MTTIYLAHTVPVNPPGLTPLTEAQVFRGFQRKIRRPWDFVPAIEKPVALAEDKDAGVVKRLVTFKPESDIHPKEVIEVCTEHPPHRVDYELDNGSTIFNIISTGSGGEGDLYITYAFAWKHPELEGADAEPSSAAYQAAEAGHKKIAKHAIESSITTTRQLVQVGDI